MLRISTECYTCYHWLPNLLKSHNRCFPNVEIQILAEATGQPINYLLEGKLDIAIVSCLTKSDNQSNLNFTELFTDEKVVVVGVNHRFARQSTVKPAQFTDEHLLCYTAPIEVLDIFQRVLIPNGVSPKKLTRIELTEAIVEMVKADLGITVMAKWAIKPYLKSKKLVAIPVENHALERTWYAVTIQDEYEPQFIKCFVQHLVKHPII